MDFGYAENVGGECILRFDDTNPEAEKQEYIDHINDIVHWMGYKPSKVHRIPSYSICFMSRRSVAHCMRVLGVGHLLVCCPVQVTHSAYYFKELHEFAVELIESGHAYVDHQTADEIKHYR